jgi:asparagine synthase (glutamine-hydrolysing)
MCDIAGFYSSKKAFDKINLENITNSMPHRGPDAAGFYMNDDMNCGIGHRRLSIIDLSANANQPMHSHCNNFVMVFNGEVYNYQHIATQLQVDFFNKFNKKIEFKTHSDTEVILEAYCFYGNDFVKKLNGMFSIVIYNKLSHQLFICRDRMGKKPLYYYHQNDVFVFGSELKAITKFTTIKSSFTLNHSAINQFLHVGYIAEPMSIYNEVHKFPAGAFATLANQQITTEYYWKAEDKISLTTISNFDEAKTELKKLLLQSVNYRMISDVPFGTFLSGGIDSSLVTAMAQVNSTQPINTFSIGFKESKFNESQYARKIANHLATKHHEFIVSENDVLGLLEKIPQAYDEPFADSSSLPTMLVSKLAKQHVTMTLSGDGGDELMMGYGMYNWANRLNNPFVKAFRKPTAFALRQLSSKYKRVADVLDYESNEKIHGHIFSQEQYFFSQDELKKLVTNNYKSNFNFEYNFTTNRHLSAAEQQALFDIKYYLKDDLLTKVDRASMQFSLETRTPLLDYHVVEYCLNIHESLKMKNGTQKYLLKEILFDYVPREFYNRPKWGFSIPLIKWLKTDLKYLIDDCLNEKVITQAGFVNYAVVKDLVNKYLRGKHDYLYNRLWVLIQLHQWHLLK